MQEIKKTGNVIDIYIRIILLSILLLLSFFIVKPFLIMIVWSAILGIALYPFYQKVIGWFGGKRKGLVTSLFVIILLALILVPAVNLTNSVIETTSEYASDFRSGKINIPVPNEKLNEFPIVGKKIYEAWTGASKNLESFIKKNRESVANILGSFFNKFKGMMGSVLLALISLIIAGAFMASADSINKNAIKLGNKLLPGEGEDLIVMVTSTVRSVVKGILAVALIQSLLAYIGFAIAGLPGAAFFAFLVMIMAIIQLPPIIAMIPAIAIYASVTDSNTALVIFTVYSIVVSMSDNLLKPMLLGKGLQTPMLVILIGAIGGMIFMGMIGLFIGPVILAIAYQMYIEWINGKNISKTPVK
jgi:predicted PurR-regulated permease PerM